MATLVRVTRNWRVTIPREVRQEVGIGAGDILAVEAEDDCIWLRRLERPAEGETTTHGGQDTGGRAPARTSPEEAAAR